MQGSIGCTLTKGEPDAQFTAHSGSPGGLDCFTRGTPVNDNSPRATPKADVHGHRVLMFFNNPQVNDPSYGWVDPTGFSPSYDILTDPDPSSYSVRVNAKSVDDGDIAVVYRVDAHATNRDPGKIVAIARITSGPWFSRDGYAFVNWTVRCLPPERWIDSGEMKSSGLWTNRVPLSRNKQASSPVQLDEEQWGWLAPRLPASALAWLEEHTVD